MVFSIRRFGALLASHPDRSLVVFPHSFVPKTLSKTVKLFSSKRRFHRRLHPFQTSAQFGFPVAFSCDSKQSPAIFSPSLLARTFFHFHLLVHSGLVRRTFGLLFGDFFFFFSPLLVVVGWFDQRSAPNVNAVRRPPSFFPPSSPGESAGPFPARRDLRQNLRSFALPLSTFGSPLIW